MKDEVKKVVELLRDKSNTNVLDYIDDAADMLEELAAENEHLLSLSRRMHEWIFLYTVDEQEVYDKLGLTDEDNARLGYIGRAVLTRTRGDRNG